MNALRTGLLVFTALLLAGALNARTPDESDRLYHEIGSQLFCVCNGCREGLLVCSMNNCRAKDVQTDYLRSLCENASLKAPAIKDAMVDRFGTRVLQVPSDSQLFPILAIAVLVLGAAFVMGFRAVTRRGGAPTQLPEPGRNDELDERIRRDLKDLD